jgi:hypothetical protein
MARVLISILVFGLTLNAQFFGGGKDPHWQTNGAGPLASRPAHCKANRDLYVCNGTGCGTNGEYHYCTATDTYSVVAGGSGPQGLQGLQGPAGPSWVLNSLNCNGSTDLDLSTATTYNITLTGNCTLTTSNPSNGKMYNLLVCQDSTGGHTLTWPSTLYGATPTIGTLPNACSLQVFLSSGSALWGLSGGGYISTSPIPTLGSGSLSSYLTWGWGTSTVANETNGIVITPQADSSQHAIGNLYANNLASTPGSLTIEAWIEYPAGSTHLAFFDAAWGYNSSGGDPVSCRYAYNSTGSVNTVKAGDSRYAGFTSGGDGPPPTWTDGSLSPAQTALSASTPIYLRIEMNQPSATNKFACKFSFDASTWTTVYTGNGTNGAALTNGSFATSGSAWAIDAYSGDPGVKVHVMGLQVK